MNLLDVYPFTPSAFPPEAGDAMRRELARLSREFAVFGCAYRSSAARGSGRRGGEDRYHAIVSAFIEHCCRPVPSEESIALLTHFVYIIFYYDDFSRSDDYRARVEAFLDVIHGRYVPGEDAVTRCLRDFAQRLFQATCTSLDKLSAFQQACERSWSSFLWESRGMPAQGPAQGIDCDTYRAMRRDKIAARPFLELGKMTNVHSLALERCFGPLTRRLDWLAVEIQYVANDLYSVEKDCASGQENLVAIVAREQGCSLDEAMAIVQGEHGRLVDTFVRRSPELIQAVDAVCFDGVDREQAERYLLMLQGCIWGNIAAVLDLGFRYGSAASQAAERAQERCMTPAYADDPVTGR